MVFSDTDQKLGLLQDIEMKLFGDNGYGRITGNDDLLYQFTARINRRQDRFVYLSMRNDGPWQNDDANNTTDFPIATRDIVSGRRDYAMPVSMIQISKVVLTDPSGNKHEIFPLDISDKSNQTKSYLENQASNVGTPTYYDKEADALILQPTPNYNSTGGIEVFYKRGPYYFVNTDTTNRSPGFPSILHEYLSAGAAYDYACDRVMPSKVATLGQKVAEMEKMIAEHYGRRRLDENRVMTAMEEDNH